MKSLEKGFRMKVTNAFMTRLKFMKIASIYHEIKRCNAMNSSNLLNVVIVHTGQYDDYGVSKVLFKDLDHPKSNICLKLDSDTHCVHY